jgi:hypothetical protein
MAAHITSTPLPEHATLVSLSLRRREFWCAWRLNMCAPVILLGTRAALRTQSAGPTFGYLTAVKSIGRFVLAPVCSVPTSVTSARPLLCTCPSSCCRYPGETECCYA